MDLSQVPNQLGTAVLKISTGQILETTGQLDGLEVDKTLSNIYNMMKVRMIYLLAQIKLLAMSPLFTFFTLCDHRLCTQLQKTSH